MKKIYTLSLLVFLSVIISSLKTSAQCPTQAGMLGTPVVLNGFCFINIQFAIPNSNVSIYNASGFVAQGTANGSGNVVISYPCASNPLTSIVSIITSPVVQVCNLSNFTQIITLPVKLVSFEGKLNSQKKVTLSWKTAYELNSERFDIEKSTDGINYKLIGVINSSENSFSEKAYSFDDLSFSAGTSAFYRLKQVDLDGKTSYSKISYISDKTSPEISLFPNPVQPGESVVLKGVAASEVRYQNIRVSDFMGRNIPYKITGANSIELPATLKAGIYIVKVMDKALKLVKE